MSMIGQGLRQTLRWGLLLAVAASAGCTGGFDGLFARLKREPLTDVVPGVTPPAERLAALGSIREKAAWAEPAERRQLAAQLAASYRDEQDPAIRAEIVRSAAGYRAEPTMGMLRAAMVDASADVRVAACGVLGQWKDPESLKLLSGALASDLDHDVRVAAVAALGETGDAAAVDALGQALDDRDPAMQYLAVQSLRKITRADLENDVDQWRQYVRGELPAASEPVSLAERFWRLF